MGRHYNRRKRKLTPARKRKRRKKTKKRLRKAAKIGGAVAGTLATLGALYAGAKGMRGRGSSKVTKGLKELPYGAVGTRFNPLFVD